MSKLKYMVSIFMIVYLGCTDRGIEKIATPELNPPHTDFLLTINPTEFGYEEQTTQGNFKKAVFVNFESNDVWAMYIKKNGIMERLSWELSIDFPLPFILHSDKYIDKSGIRHIAVTGGYPVNNNSDLNNIQISIAKADFNNPLGENFHNQFQIIQPTLLGQENTINGDRYIEAVFVGIDPIDIWAIVKTSSNGYKAKVNLSRRVSNAKNYYLYKTTYIDPIGNSINASKVGLNTQNYMDFSNIEVIIEK